MNSRSDNQGIMRPADYRDAGSVSIPANEPRGLQIMNKTTSAMIAVALFFMLRGDTINAQVFSPLPAGHQAIYTGFGLDPAFVMTVGYAQSRNGWIPDRDHLVISELALPIQLDVHDYRVKIGVQSSIIGTDHLDLSAGISFIARGTENSIHRAVGFGADVVFLLGYYGRFGSLAGEAGLDKGLLTHIKHSDWYRTYYYSDAQDGWYGNTAGSLRYGLRIGLRIARAEITLRAGVCNSGSFSQLFMPFYGVLGMNFRVYP